MTIPSTRSVALFVATLAMGTTLPFAASSSMTGLSMGDTIISPMGVATKLHPA